MSRFVALLRAINTPPRHVKMDRLAVIGREVYWSHVGLRRDSEHSEARVTRTLGMQTTQRSATTVRRIADRFLR
jgi:uncharacterized protein (DUF1697 family)